MTAWLMRKDKAPSRHNQTRAEAIEFIVTWLGAPDPEGILSQGARVRVARRDGEIEYELVTNGTLYSWVPYRRSHEQEGGPAH